MEDIILAIVPVGEGSSVRTCQLNGLRSLSNLLLFGLCTLALVSPVLRLVRRAEIHLMWVDNFGLFLKIEGALVILDLSLGQLAIVVLSVVRKESPWIWITHESVSASRLS